MEDQTASDSNSAESCVVAAETVVAAEAAVAAENQAGESPRSEPQVVLPDLPAESGTNAFFVKLDLFDGPIDLLLHLVKQNELSIEKVSLAQVTSQYLQCIKQMRNLDLEIAGEYLVIAATLVSIKSSVLLNKPVELVQDEDGNLIDPHEELLRKLREAAIYRDGARLLGGRDLLGTDVFSPPGVVFPGEEPEVVLKEHDAMLLGKAFHKLLKSSGAPVALMTISVDSVSIVERMVGVLDKLRAAGAPVEFERLVPELTNRGAIVSTFLALLELCKRQVIAVRQDVIFEKIFIALSAKDFDAAQLASQYDITSANEGAAAQKAV